MQVCEQVHIDVSHYQNEAGGGGTSAIKWARVRNAGVKFTIIKISDKTSKDAFAVRNVADAKAAGLLVGGYHLLRNTASGAPIRRRPFSTRCRSAAAISSRRWT